MIENVPTKGDQDNLDSDMGMLKNVLNDGHEDGSEGNVDNDMEE